MLIRHGINRSFYCTHFFCMLSEAVLQSQMFHVNCHYVLLLGFFSKQWNKKFRYFLHGNKNRSENLVKTSLTVPKKCVPPQIRIELVKKSCKKPFFNCHVWYESVCVITVWIINNVPKSWKQPLRPAISATFILTILKVRTVIQMLFRKL